MKDELSYRLPEPKYNLNDCFKIDGSIYKIESIDSTCRYERMYCLREKDKVMKINEPSCIRLAENTLDNFEKIEGKSIDSMTAIELIKFIYDASYICDMCKKRIYPIITEIVLGDSPTMSVSNDSTSITTGYKKLSSSICNKCKAKIWLV